MACPQMAAFFLAFIPLAAGVHHSAPAVGSAEMAELLGPTPTGSMSGSSKATAPAASFAAQRTSLPAPPTAPETTSPPAAAASAAAAAQMVRPPRNTHCWMEGQQGAEKDFGAHIVASATDHSVAAEGDKEVRLACHHSRGTP